MKLLAIAESMVSVHPTIARFLKPGGRFDDGGTYLESRSSPETYYGPFKDDFNARGAAAVVAGLTRHPSLDGYSLDRTPFVMAGDYGAGELTAGHDGAMEGNLSDLQPHEKYRDVVKYTPDFMHDHFGR